MTPPRRRFGLWLRPSRRSRVATLEWELEVALKVAAERPVTVYLDGKKIAEATTRKCPARVMVAGVALTCDMRPDHDGIHQSPLRLEGGVVARIHWRGIHGGVFLNDVM